MFSRRGTVVAEPKWGKADAMNKGGFSWKRAVGITNAKRKVSRATGIPWTKSGRQRKVGGMFWKFFK